MSRNALRGVPRVQRGLWLAVLSALAATPLAAQTIDDSLMMSRKSLCTGFLFLDDRWDRYWEGTLERANANVGQVSTEQVLWMGTYGVTDRLNVIGMLPYVWTGASGGVMRGMRGFQDLTLAGKLRFLSARAAGRGSVNAFAVASFATPVSDYTPDDYPFSIGTHSRRVAGRLTLDYQTPGGWYLDGSASYTWRANVTLDREAYYTEGRLFLTNEVQMPDVVEWTVRAGFLRGGLHVPLSFTQQITLGGDDIRRQDMPFVSNRMDASRLDALVMYDVPKAKGLAVRVGATVTVSGRNVGRATTFLAGLLYRAGF